MKKPEYSWRYKLVAIVLSLIFVFVTMETIDSHAYTTGVYNFKFNCGCLGCF